MSFCLKKSVKIAYFLLCVFITLGGSFYYFSLNSTAIEHRIIPFVIFIYIIASSLLLTNTLEINDDHIAIRISVFRRMVFFKNVIQVDGIQDKSDFLICTKTNQSKEVLLVIMVYENRIQLENELKRVLIKHNISFT